MKEKTYPFWIKGRLVELTESQISDQIEKSLTLEDRVKRIELYLGIKTLQDFVKRNNKEL